MPVVIADSTVLIGHVVSNELMDALITKLGTPAATVRLFVNDYTPTPDMTPDSFVEASYAGYANSELPAFGGTEQTLQGGAKANTAAVLEWFGPSTGDGQTIYGYYLTDDPLVHVYGAYRFPVPVPLNDTDNLLSLVVGVSLPAVR